MNNPNPFVPKGSLLEQQSQRRSRLKLAVFCVLAVCVTGLVAMLIQGCKREKPDTDAELNPPPLDLASNSMVADYTNTFPTEVSNPPVEIPPLVSNPPPELPPIVPAASSVAPVASSEYTVVKGDYLAKIAKNNGVSVKALEAANPTVIPTRLKIGEKLVIPVGSKPAPGVAAPAMAAGETSYTVKSGDTLTSIARKYHTTYKAIEAANNLITTKIRVGQKLKIPSKVESAPPVSVPPPAPAPLSAPAPALPPISAPAPANTAPASGQ